MRLIYGQVGSVLRKWNGIKKDGWVFIIVGRSVERGHHLFNTCLVLDREADVLLVNDINMFSSFHYLRRWNFLPFQIISLNLGRKMILQFPFNISFLLSRQLKLRPPYTVYIDSCSHKQIPRTSPTSHITLL